MKEIKMYEACDGKTFNSRAECENYERLNTYYVEMELSGFVVVTVKAANEDEARNLAAESFYSEDVDFEIINFGVYEK